MRDTYLTISAPSAEVLFKDRKSKFFGYAFPIDEERMVKPIIEELKKKHPNANHFCYAWQLGVEAIRYRTNDDGEPNNSAGKPIYGQIQAFGITNVLIVVARIFGGAKLGVGGLINAYRSAAQMALGASEIEKRILEERLELVFDYTLMNEVMRAIKKMKLTIVSQEMKERCILNVSFPRSNSTKVRQTFKKLHQVKINQV